MLRVVARGLDRFVDLLLLVFVLGAAGCGGGANHGDRVPLTGTISVKGQPLDVKATIFFDPLPGDSGIGSAAEVTGGRFIITEDMGPMPGKTYNVKVVTVPGIPEPGTPPAEIKRTQTFEKQVAVPPRDAEPTELKIDFE